MFIIDSYFILLYRCDIGINIHYNKHKKIFSISKLLIIYNNVYIYIYYYTHLATLIWGFIFQCIINPVYDTKIFF